MLVEKNVPLQACNTFHIVAKAHTLVRVRSEGDLLALVGDPELAAVPKFVLGGGSNIARVTASAASGTGWGKGGDITATATSRASAPTAAEP